MWARVELDSVVECIALSPASYDFKSFTGLRGSILMARCFSGPTNEALLLAQLTSLSLLGDSGPVTGLVRCA